MTLIIAHASPEAQILVADRKITNAYSGKVLDDTAYKIIQYLNHAQDYVFGVAYTGLAKIEGENTSDWLMDILPITMPPEMEIGKAFLSFADECSKRFSKIRGIASNLKATTFIFCGRFNEFSSKNIPLCSFVSVVSNCVDKRGRQVSEVSSDFKVLKWARPLYDPNVRPTTTICRGDLIAASKYGTTLKKIKKKMRSDIAPDSKIHMAKQYIRLVAGSSKTIGQDVLSLCLYADGTSSGGEYPNWKNKITRTMPHLVTAEGTRMTHFQVTCEDGFIGE